MFHFMGFIFIPQTLNQSQPVIIFLLHMQTVLSYFYLFIINKCNILCLQSELMTCTTHIPNKTDIKMVFEKK